MQQTICDYRISLEETLVLKGFAILAMVFHHLFLDTSVYGEWLFLLNPFIAGLAIVCKVCLPIFLFLSGYGLSVKYIGLLEVVDNYNVAKKTLRFIIGRLLKFYLSYWFVFLIFIPLGIFIFNRPMHVAYGTNLHVYHALVCDFFGVQGFCSYNVTWWFNKLIITLYILFPLLFSLMKKKMVAVIFLIFMFCFSQTVSKTFVSFDNQLSAYMFIFSLGVFVARKRELVNRYLNRMSLKILLISVTAMFLLISYVRQKWGWSFWESASVDSMNALFFILMIMSAIRFWGNKYFKPLIFLGKHSMNIYLVHTFIISYFFHEFIYGLKNPLLMFIVAFGASLVLSILLEFIKKEIRFYKLRTTLLQLLGK